ncbi:MAG TPA: hypothetical protein VF292_00800, partial [Rhodanobacteraceae bacterium]
MAAPALRRVRCNNVAVHMRDPAACARAFSDTFSVNVTSQDADRPASPDAAVAGADTALTAR